MPGVWPIDQLYEAYLRDADNVLLITHVGGRRAILDWHHPKLERLIEVSSYGFVPIYLMGRQVDDAKAWTSPLFITFL